MDDKSKKTQEAEELGVLLLTQLMALFGGDDETIAEKAAILYLALDDAGYRKTAPAVYKEETQKTDSTTKLSREERLKRDKAACKNLQSVRQKTAKEILDRVARRHGRAWLADIYIEYGIEVDE